MTASLWPAVVDALVSTLTAANLDGVVFDGPPPADDSTMLGVAIGMATADDVEDAAGTTSQTWRDAGPAPQAAREERGTVRCTAWAWSGDDWQFAARRAQLAGLLDDISDTLAAVTPMGLQQIVDLRLADSITWVQTQSKGGTTVEAMFTVAYTAIVT